LEHGKHREVKKHEGRNDGCHLQLGRRAIPGG
jgi:hypothetical protein